MEDTHLLVDPDGEVFTAGSESTCKLSLKFRPFCKIIKIEDATKEMLESYESLRANFLDVEFVDGLGMVIFM